MVSSMRNSVVFSRNDSVGGGKIGEPSSCRVKNGASPSDGMPRTKTLAPVPPPLASAQTPGTIFSRSAVLVGAVSWICSGVAVLIEKLASRLRRPLNLAVPLTMTASSVVASSLAGAGAASWAPASTGASASAMAADRA